VIYSRNFPAFAQDGIVNNFASRRRSLLNLEFLLLVACKHIAPRGTLLESYQRRIVRTPRAPHLP
jgi:hypothetical protein